MSCLTCIWRCGCAVPSSIGLRTATAPSSSNSTAALWRASFRGTCFPRKPPDRGGRSRCTSSRIPISMKKNLPSAAIIRACCICRTTRRSSIERKKSGGKENFSLPPRVLPGLVLVRRCSMEIGSRTVRDAGPAAVRRAIRSCRKRPCAPRSRRVESGASATERPFICVLRFRSQVTRRIPAAAAFCRHNAMSVSAEQSLPIPCLRFPAEPVHGSCGVPLRRFFAPLRLAPGAGCRGCGGRGK